MNSLRCTGVNGTVSVGAAAFKFVRRSKTKRWISRTCNPAGPASRKISTMWAASRKRMADENWACASAGTCQAIMMPYLKKH